MFKKVTAIICAFVMVSVLFLVPSFNSHAMGSGLSYTTEFDVNYAQPYCSDYSGYLSVLYFINGDDYYRLYTYFWTIQPHGSKEYSTNVFSTMYVTINRGEIIFEPSCVADCNYYTNICAYDTNQNLHILQTSANTDSFGSTLTENYGNCTIVGYTFGGNINIRGVSDLKDVFCPTIHWNSSGEAAQLNTYLNSILNSLSNLDTDVSDLRFDLIQIVNMNVLIDEKLSILITWLSSSDWRLSKIMDDLKVVINEQEKTNTWLEKILEHLKQANEEAKQEAQEQGESSTSQGMNAIEDKGAGFTSSLGGLTNSMSYTGTQCAWEFPEVKLPAISGVMDEMVLIKKQPIDFAVWVNAIPSDILLVVQSLCTVGLIIYCFKELYSTIAYVLTLRKDDNS